MRIVEGDLLTVTSGLIVHGCNAQGKMKSGVAKAIREKWPIVYKAYKDQEANGTRQKGLGLLTGIIIPVKINKKLTVINAITQKYYGYDGKKYVSYDALDDCMQRIAENYEPDIPIAMPKIGSDRGGGNWKVIKYIIKHRLDEFDVTIYVKE